MRITIDLSEEHYQALKSINTQRGAEDYNALIAEALEGYLNPPEIGPAVTAEQRMAMVRNVTNRLSKQEVARLGKEGRPKRR